ncbi:MAG: hypothetical protein J3K34DRAFT_521153 [Monoraphidium minutum]|nr:MAG: hypothetical protein J3K34DRAFT_521153 [Monoraphidium minutum]
MGRKGKPRGDTRKLRRLLRKHPPAARGAAGGGDDGAAAALREAARRGHIEAVALLVRHSADAGAADALGNTAAHLALQSGHIGLLVTLLQADRPPDIDAPNAAGVTVRQLSQAAMDAAAAATAAQQRWEQHRQQQLAAAAAAPGGGEGGEDDEWRRKLRDEMSDDEAGGIGYGRYRPTPADDTFVWPAGLDEGGDDEWADRLWQEMARRQRADAAAAAREAGLRDAAGARAAADAERRRKAAAAAAESARILGEERAKEANWRDAMLRQVAEAGLPTRRREYEAAWAALEARVRAPGGPPVHYRDIPWPTRALAAARGAAGVAAAAAGGGGGGELRDLILFGVDGAAELKKRLRSELMRWHPDKFGARIAPRVAPADAEAATAGVRAVAQQLTALMGG